ncbi:MAG: AAA family ATPase [Patescibacteria group bacterium]
MARIISFCNQKGGVGKTTSAVNFAAYSAARGRKTLLVDFDPQGNATSAFFHDKNRLVRSVYDALVHEMDPFDIIKKTKLHNLDLLPSNSALAGATIELVAVKRREYRLLELLQKIEKRYDYIVIDLPPSLGLFLINALVASRYIIIPVQCEYYALEGLAELLRTFTLVSKNLKARNEILGVVLTMYDRTNGLHRAVAKEIKKKFPGYVFETVIPRNIKLAEAPSHTRSILHYAPYSHGAKAYQRFTDEVFELIEINHKNKKE